MTLVLSILLSCVGLNVKAEGSAYIEHISCVNEHIEWVQSESKFPINNVGNCPFVSMSLLLSYYDAYWDDGFVPNNYETIGTIDTNNGQISEDFHLKLENNEWLMYLYGVDTPEELKYVDFKSVDTTSADSRRKYGQFVDNNASDFFNLYLISLALNSNFNFYDRLNTYGLSAMQMVSFLEYYLYNIRGFSEEQVTVNKMSALLPNGRYGMFNKATELIEDGFPVIYCAGETSLDNLILDDPSVHVDNVIAGHVLLGYKTGNSDIYLSPCWNGHSSQMFSTTTYRYISSIIWLEINEDAFPHVCSVSYVDANDPNRTFCTCEIYRDHPNHVDSINSGAEICPMGSSTATCLCGEPIKNTHNYCYINHSDVQHWLECACGKKTNWETHNEIYTHSDNAGHSGYCECGYEFTNKAHRLTNCVPVPRDAASYHIGTCACGFSGTEPHTFEDIGLGKYRCTKCVYTKVPGSGNVPVHLGIEDDTENEMS